MDLVEYQVWTIHIFFKIFDSFLSEQVIELILERKGAYKETFEKIKSDVMKLQDRKEEEAGRAAKRPRI